MKTRHLGWLLGITAIASTFFSCAQAKIVCRVGNAGSGSGYAVIYKIKGTAPACAAKTTHPTGVTLDKLKGEVLGFETYHPAEKTGDEVRADYTKTNVAWKSDALGGLLIDKEGKDAGDPNKDHHPYAFGSFTTTEPGADGFCVVNITQPAEQDFGDVPAMAGQGGGMPATEEEFPVKVKYEWENLKLYVTAAAPATQFIGDLKYTQTVDPDPMSKTAPTEECTVEYHAIGMWPAVGCEATDADGKGTGKPDATLCSADADPDNGRPLGSGINPDFPTECDPDLLLCVLKGDPPSFTTPAAGR